jgi:type IV pilus assembly protein PilC
MLIGISLKNKVFFFRQLSTLIDSGMPILGALEALERMPTDRIRGLVRAIAPKIAEGESLSSAFEKYPQYFESFIVQMIRAGEIGGSLERRLIDIADYLEMVEKQQTSFILRMIYPALLINAGFLIPPIFLFITKGPCAYFQKAIIPLIILYTVTIILFFLYRAGSLIPGIKDFMDLFFLHFPLFSWFFKTRASYRFLWVLADMLEAGIDRIVSFKASADASGNIASKLQFEKVIPDLEEGKSLVYCLKKTGLFKPMVLELIYSGEISGKLPESIKKAAEWMEKQVNNMMTVVTIVMPIFFYIAVAAYIGSMIVSTFSDIYKPLENIFPK